MSVIQNAVRGETSWIVGGDACGGRRTNEGSIHSPPRANAA
jgi:hypothetical protein